jgi:hypothetical protein
MLWPWVLINTSYKHGTARKVYGGPRKSYTFT